MKPSPPTPLCFPVPTLLYITLVLGKSYLVCKFNSSANEIDVLWVFISNYQSAPKFMCRIYNLRDKLFWQSDFVFLFPVLLLLIFEELLNMSSVMHTAPQDVKDSGRSLCVVSTNFGCLLGGSWQFGPQFHYVTAQEAGRHFFTSVEIKIKVKKPFMFTFRGRHFESYSNRDYDKDLPWLLY